MKYIAKKNIPLFPITIKKGDILDSEKWENRLDLENKDFFAPFIEPSYSVGDLVLIKNPKTFALSLFKITETYIDGSQLAVQISDKTKITITNKTKIIKPTMFWFVNSNGKIQSDYEERKQIDKDGVVFKKACGNYHLSYDDAAYYKNNFLIKES